MQTSRRQFITQSALTIAGAALFSNKIFAANKSSDHIVGIQLYSVRDDMKKDPAATLKQLAAMGYTHVEHANYENRKFYSYEPAAFKSCCTILA